MIRLNSPNGMAYLSNREVQVVGLASQGLTRKEIAKRLFIEENTVKSHIRRVTARLGAGNTTHVVAIALREGVIR